MQTFQKLNALVATTHQNRESYLPYPLTFEGIISMRRLKMGHKNLCLSRLLHSNNGISYLLYCLSLDFFVSSIQLEAHQ